MTARGQVSKNGTYLVHMALADGGRWVRTVGGPAPGDQRDGELHQVFDDELPEHFDLEPWDDAVDAADARYVRRNSPPFVDEDGREIWLYDFEGLSPS